MDGFSQILFLKNQNLIAYQKLEAYHMALLQSSQRHTIWAQHGPPKQHEGRELLVVSETQKRKYPRLDATVIAY
ncbi:hypothetical protein C5167_036371 [Papaver somniferum]|uniref:Uncharacterized protein n=1 Tax=Papaver somniferum TaxID=3469 RepID=A0A4Y7I7K4_PAPSO|nr:hypothetical protein C5167_036371 [Papaver somniferum]